VVNFIGKPMRSINPATEEIIREYPEHQPEHVQRTLERANAAFGGWRKCSFVERADLMQRAAQVLRSRKDEFARLMTLEMGKPIAGAEAEVEKCAVCCDYFAGNAERLLAIEHAQTDATRSYARFDPVGAVLAIMPWNFPFWQVFRFAAPGLMAGNVGVLKHAANVPGCALAIEDVFRQAGFAEGVFSTLLINRQTTEQLIDNPAIRAVTLTGSGAAGMSVGSRAGKALKKSVLELGGSDPFIVLRDVDVEKTAEAAANARCINSGQSCIAAKRFIVDETIAAQFEEAFAEKMRNLKVGDPTDRSTEVGPMARLDLLEDLHRQVQESVSEGAKLLTGGKRVSRKGYFYEPTVLANVRPGMIAFDEETFGPVAAVIRAKDADDAVRLANHSRYGLGASIWTNDIELAERMAGDIEAGCVFVNGAVKSDPRLPFGGVKESGYGRELAEPGIKEFVNIKTIWINGTGPARTPGRME
jgi:succinate-semialdehyde dehydrogenase/glutarate-semialdehyde dehydrogenase